MTDRKQKRVLSGMRPTGRLHIGHYFGALSNWLKMQNARLPDGSPEYESFHFVADWHALTTHYADSSQVATNTLEVATDWLAVGLDPRVHDNVTLFIQSSVPEHAELHLLLSMITPLSWLERVPTYKEQIENLREKDLGTYGFLGYPLLQSADIVMYGEPGKQLLVPVGEDQVPHIEMTREIVRKFNMHNIVFDAAALAKHPIAVSVIQHSFDPDSFRGPRLLPNFCTEEFVTNELQPLVRKRVSEVGFKNYLAQLDNSARANNPEFYKAEVQKFQQFREHHDVFRRFFKETLVEPDVILTETPRVPGTDGRRMAKSYGNAIWLSDTEKKIRDKVKSMMTDPARRFRTDKGHPEVCPVFAYHNLFPENKSNEDCARIDRVNHECRTAAIGCVDCKKLMADALVKWIAPIQERRAKYEANPAEVWDVLEAGSRRAKKVAEQTMARVRKAVFNWEGAGRKTSVEGKAVGD